CKDPGCACHGDQPMPKPDHCGCDKKPPQPPCPPPQPPCPPPQPPCPPPAPRPSEPCRKGDSGGFFGLLAFLAFAILIFALSGLFTGHKDSTTTTIIVNPPCKTDCEKPKPPTPPTPQPTPACPGICKPSAAPPEPPVTPPVSEGCSEANNPSSRPPTFILPY